MIITTGTLRFVCSTLQELQELEASARAQVEFFNIVVDEANLTISMEVDSTRG